MNARPIFAVANLQEPRPMRKLGWLSLVAGFAIACANDRTSADAGAAPPSEVTYWKDMVPLFEQHCLQCHQEGGIGQVRLDLYAEAKEHAALIGFNTSARLMPPWGATSDGSCGDFRDSLALDDAQIALIAGWVEGGAKEGEPGRVNVPAPDRLENASDYALPNYAPVVQGGMLAEHDDYHCFLLDANVAAERFITGYDIVPGTPEIVHHVLVMVVDPDAPADLTEAPEDAMLPDGATNAQVMAALDAESPDQPGWPCWGQAGEGVFVRSTPVVWAPGQGVVHFPGESGASLRPTDKLVVQVHYNLHDPELRGKTDETHVLLELAQDVPNRALFAVPDALLESLFGPEPDTLEPGKASVLYSFERTVEELDLEDSTGGPLAETQLSELKLWGVMPYSLRTCVSVIGSRPAVTRPASERGAPGVSSDALSKGHFRGIGAPVLTAIWCLGVSGPAAAVDHAFPIRAQVELQV
jgi:mono/diheme cytochrome c family protein